MGNFERNPVPILQQPLCGVELPLPETQNLLFNWTPMHLGNINAPSLVEYEFELVEMLPGIVNPNDGFDNALQVYQGTTTSPSFLYTQSEPLLEPNKVYAWRVRAYDPMGSDVFQNEGKSLVCTFSYTTNYATDINQVLSSGCEAFVTDVGPVPYNNTSDVQLSEGETVKLGLFEMSIQRIDGQGNGYTGTGIVQIPFLKAKVVVEFEDFKIRPDKRVYEVDTARAKLLAGFAFAPSQI